MGKDKSKSDAFSDPRFAAAKHDHRFKLPSLKKNKVKVDERFSRLELKKLNVSGERAKVDRYGRKLDDDSDEEFEKYFTESEEESRAAEPVAESAAESDPESELGSSHEEFQGFVDRARGEGLVLSDDSDSSSDEAESEVEEEKPEEGDPSLAFAVVNLDWDNVRAVDLMATFSSFVPKGGLIKSVTIYPSEFGKEQMQKEEVEGPPRELFKKKKKDDSDSDEELDLEDAKDLEKAARKLYQEDDGKEDYDSKALRKYQLQRLRYYYAVVQCDSVATAKNIYANCDGAEYESTANVFDLRYVPEEMEFDEGDAKESCTKVPASYRPDLAFVTDALQHSKVKLTWDETPKERMTLSSRHFSQKEVDEMDFQAYLASDSEDEGNADKLKSLLGNKFSFDKGEESDEVDMEITFNPGLDEKAPVTEPKEETTIEAYKRKEKERRKKRMEKHETKEPEKRKAKHRGKPRVDEKEKAELELLMMDDDEKKHFSMRDIIKGEKGKKGKRVEDDFEVDLHDPRFAEVFESHEYAIDPTSSDFKKTKTMKKILEEKSKRRKSQGEPRAGKKVRR